MNEQLVFYSHPWTRGRGVHVFLEELGVAYEYRVVDLVAGEHKGDEFLALNPMGKLPVLQHGELLITESAAIYAYLADRFAPGRYAPFLDDPARAKYLRALFFSAGTLEYALFDRFLGRAIEGDRAKMAIGYGSLDETLGALEAIIGEGPFILGDQISAADFALGAQLEWAVMAKVAELGPRALALRERLLERESFKRAKAESKRILAALKGEG